MWLLSGRTAKSSRHAEYEFIDSAVAVANTVVFLSGDPVVRCGKCHKAALNNYP